MGTAKRLSTDWGRKERPTMRCRMKGRLLSHLERAYELEAGWE